ncbi:DUF3307 domain-containing protein [Virgibacillus sp. SK37]|uniref:DUF3307 domain-containing protein n=1 Tax=Virgibacillus sp. SK37 TaxID=403957 RepID=UPI0004D18FBE|nr:DUF3307 domain-containing protein [Virgibacillus sp. SK37]AIF44926.1 hypothetical protein X953_18855 [Virgibacillus sp. SK37]
MNLLILIFAHLLADYPLQGDFLAQQKGKNMIALITHAGIWTGVIATAAFLIGIDINLFDILFLFIVHAVADYMKAKPVGFYKKLNPLGAGLIIDQSIHLIQILVLLIYKGFI